ncbi:MAG: glycosyltransferase [Francisella endosymbiont of Hyalomma asiaticum]
MFHHHREKGLPVNILEAFAVGLPVFASDCRGNRDLVAEEYLFEVGDVDRLKDLIVKKVNTIQKYTTKINIKDYRLDKCIRELRKFYDS